jgi:hypothetical protein
MLLGAAPIASGDREQISGRWAREFVSPWTPPYPATRATIFTGDPRPNVVGVPASSDTQSLWIDTESLLPVRWEATRRGMVTHSFAFTYESIDIRPPAGVNPPTCIR